MPYVFYHILHLLSLIAFVSSTTIQLKTDSVSRLPKWVTGLSSFFLLFSGMGLLAKIGNSMEPWVHIKLGVWLLAVMLVPITAKRFPEKKGMVFNVVMFLLLTAVYAVSTKLR